MRSCAAKTSSSHFFTTTTHHWLLFFTNLGRVYRAKGYELPEAGRDAKGQHVANLLAFQPGEEIAQVLAIKDYEQAALPRPCDARLAS
ncbi:MAG: DNA gyrase C-terminal beta-propeller domain-containing protein [Dermatophilaceae bacterium]